MRSRSWRIAGPFAAAAVCVGLNACKVGPDYRRPEAPVPAAYKEQAADAAQWKPSAPRDDGDRGAWWAFPTRT
jgi:outer membrane protein TolC